MTQADVPTPRHMPLVSVVVPTFNRAHLLPRVVESVLRQTYEAVEVVIVDDGSADGTPGLLEALAAEHGDRLRYVRQENAGCAAAINHGIEIARGELVAFIGSDDEWAPTAAETLVTALLGSPDAALVYSPAVEVFAGGTERVFEPVAAGVPESFATAHFMNTNLRSGAFLFRRDVVAEVGGLDESLRHNEDSDFVQRVAIVCSAAYSPVPTVRVHHHEENKSSDRVAITRALLQSARSVLSQYPDFALTLGSRADARIRDLEAEHVEALVLAARYAEAAEFARRKQVHMRPLIRLALLTNSLLPIRAARRWDRARRRLSWALQTALSRA
jgi:glycosyltransferase involved in cell wall biosynthesis